MAHAPFFKGLTSICQIMLSCEEVATLFGTSLLFLKSSYSPSPAAHNLQGLLTIIILVKVMGAKRKEETKLQAVPRVARRRNLLSSRQLRQASALLVWTFLQFSTFHNFVIGLKMYGNNPLIFFYLIFYLPLWRSSVWVKLSLSCRKGESVLVVLTQ